MYVFYTHNQTFVSIFENRSDLHVCTRKQASLVRLRMRWNQQENLQGINGRRRSSVVTVGPNSAWNLFCGQGRMQFLLVPSSSIICDKVSTFLSAVAVFGLPDQLLTSKARVQIWDIGQSGSGQGFSPGYFPCQLRLYTSGAYGHVIIIITGDWRSSLSARVLAFAEATLSN